MIRSPVTENPVIMPSFWDLIKSYTFFIFSIEPYQEISGFIMWFVCKFPQKRKKFCRILTETVRASNDKAGADIRHHQYKKPNDGKRRF